MAKFGVLRDGYISVNGVDLSDHCSEMKLTLSTTTLPSHAMGDEYEYSKPGLFKVACTAKFFQDFAAGEVDATLQPLWVNRTEFEVKVRADATAAISATNPYYSGLAFIESYTPIQGAHGENLMCDVTFAPASDWSRKTS